MSERPSRVTRKQRESERGPSGPAEGQERETSSETSDETPLSIRHPAEVAAGGVVVVQEAFGVTDHIEDVCQRLADAEWLAVAPHLFHRTGDPVLDHTDYDSVRPHMAALTAEGIATDVDAALDYIAGAGFPPEAAGIVGFCMGGSIALATGVRRQLGAAVTFYGGGVSQGRFGYPPLLELAPDLRTPWLGLFGDRDPSIAVDDVEALAAAAAKASVPTEVERYPDAGHGFNRDGSAAYHAESAADAWRRTLDWFARHLTTGTADIV
jgi:carboxymethylenebutenolidase